MKWCGKLSLCQIVKNRAWFWELNFDDNALFWRVVVKSFQSLKCIHLHRKYSHIINYGMSQIYESYLPAGEWNNKIDNFLHFRRFIICSFTNWRMNVFEINRFFFLQKSSKFLIHLILWKGSFWSTFDPSLFWNFVTVE